MIQGFSGGLLRNTELFYLLDLPTFQRDFAQFKTLDHATGPAITFTRASGATYFDADGVLQTAANDAPRFDHDPATGASRGLLVEEQRTNLLLSSNNFQSDWVSRGSSVVTAAAGTGLDGTNSAFNLSGASDTTFNGNNLDQAVTVSDSTTYIFSAYVKSSGGTTVILRLRDSTGAGSSSPATTVTSAWQRISISRTMAAGATSVRCIIGSTDGDILIWGAQLEQGAFATSYIPTTSAAATRAADSAVVTPISSFYNQVEGTVFAESSSTAFVDGDNQGIWGFGDDTLTFGNGNMLYAANLHPISHRIAIGVAVSGASTVSGLNNSGVPQSANTPARSICGYKTNDFAISTNGSSVATDTSGALPVVTGFSIGGLQKVWASGGNSLNGHIRKIAYWPKRLSNTLLEQLTT
jgi:hypothetical protein